MEELSLPTHHTTTLVIFGGFPPKDSLACTRSIQHRRILFTENAPTSTKLHTAEVLFEETRPALHTRRSDIYTIIDMAGQIA
jgi:hypothetical protein